MWWNIAVMIVTVAIQLATRPKPKTPKPQDVEAPVSEEGRSIRKIYGTVWVDDSMVLAFKKVGTDRIRTKGGKK